MNSSAARAAFAASCARATSPRVASFSSALCTRPLVPVVPRRVRSAARMCTEEKADDKVLSTARKTQMEEEAETPLSVWGVVSFGIIFIIFGIAVAATVARDFLPGGLAPPL